jgi:hypothetical protein
MALHRLGRWHLVVATPRLWVSYYVGSTDFRLRSESAAAIDTVRLRSEGGICVLTQPCSTFNLAY